LIIDAVLETARLELRLTPHPTQWLFREIFLSSSNEKVGEINFHRSPAGDEFTPLGTVEVGVEIAEMYQRNGFASEALMSMWLWATEHEEINVLRYTVSASNHPSMRIIQKFGFNHVGQQIDEEDGPEEIFEMSAATFRERYAETEAN
jgi:ribosomal-protein-alanine N-acetyltransferase